MFADCFYAVHTHQLELANTSLPTLVCRVKAALPELRPVSFNKPSTKRESIFPETFMARAGFPSVSQFPIRETLFPVAYSQTLFPVASRVSFCFQNANYAYATRQGILTKIRACEHF